MSERWVLGNAIIADGIHAPIEHRALLISSDTIEEVGTDSTLKAVAKAEGLPYENAGGRLVLPGLLNAHTHLYSSLAAGFSPKQTTTSFKEILEHFWWPFDESLDNESVHMSALVGVLDAVAHGVTCIFDHHASMNAVSGSLREIAKACELVGVRGLLCYETSCRKGEKAVDAHIRENIDFYESSLNNPLLSGCFGLHANFTLTDNVLKRIQADRPDQMPIHIHCAEGPEDQAYCIENGYKGPAHRLFEHGLLSPSALLAHTIHMSEEDYAAVSKSGSVPILNIESNSNNGVGKPDTDRLRGYVIGTDGMSPDIVAASRYHALATGFDGGVEPAFFANRYALEQRFFAGVKGLQPGCRADIAVLDYVPKAQVTAGNLLAHVLYGARTSRAYLTVSGGAVLFKEGHFLTVDGEQIEREAKKAALRMWRNYHD